MSIEQNRFGEQFSEQESRQQRWNELTVEIDQIKDRLGKGIDEGIKEAVIGLRALDVNVTQSCEGHNDHGTGGPYIDVESDLNTVHEKVLEPMYGNLDDKETQQKFDDLVEEINYNNLRERKKLIELLDEFYTGRETPYEIRLSVSPMARSWSRLENQGVGLQTIEEDAEKKNLRLKMFKAEMDDFKEFLKNKFFQT
ncbi:hypothetical protein IPM19_02280 [bacterium]|nr:MAG: hypothetical protein IPM19_02280 [bacterium]